MLVVVVDEEWNGFLAVEESLKLRNDERTLYSLRHLIRVEVAADVGQHPLAVSLCRYAGVWELCPACCDSRIRLCEGVERPLVEG